MVFSFHHSKSEGWTCILEALWKAGFYIEKSYPIKAGYLQGTNYLVSYQRKLKNNPFPDLVEYAAELEHCIHPEFLADQLTRSLERLQLDYLDVYLLHNPEYFLGWALHEGWDVEKARTEYYRRIKLAFEYLETQVTQGRIKSYGISSNTFPRTDTDPEYTDIRKVLEIAQKISANHHFKVIQFPMNLIEVDAANTLIHFAKENKIGILINRPLNAITNNQLIRLADKTNLSPADLTAFKNKLISLSPVFNANQTLSQMTLRALRLTPGIHCVLVGMRKKEYVRDVLDELIDTVSMKINLDFWKTINLLAV
jgi:aryl-alcohol dehydrogenase-like predicted oxidoreductase